MKPLGVLRSRLPLPVTVILGVGLGVMAAVVIARSVDGAALGDAARQAIGHPGEVVLAMSAFALAFVLRALAWRRVLPGLPFGHALSGIHLALGANHVLPFRLGEPLRVVSVMRRCGVAADEATASTLTLRASDMLTVVGLGALVAPAAFAGLVGWAGLVATAAMAVVAALSWRWLAGLARRRSGIRLAGPVAIGLSAGAWLAESVLVWQVAGWAGLELSWSGAVLVTTVAVAAQVVAFAPGGLGTYEAAAVAAYVALGFDPGPALVAALGAHGLKTAYSLVAGGAAAFWPAPSVFGHLRVAAGGSHRIGDPVPRERPAGSGGSAPELGGAPIGAPTREQSALSPTQEANPEQRARAYPRRPLAPVVLFMPAYDEEEAVAACVRRAPTAVHGHPVEVIVVDDGSSDATVERAREAGAEVLAMQENRGLGAAVRVGLHAAVERGAVAVAFCDADGEYPPEELANLVGPILTDEADYVVGSRFLGQIDHMRPHRRAGNLLLTRLLSIVARRRISDGQSGYRAFSPAAAARAEIIHDFNYAQVLTLDLLAKGFRYHEVPISYHFRTTGTSFVRPAGYLRKVVPAVYRELNAG